MPWLQHMVKHFPLSLLTPYLLSSQWQSLHQCRVHIGLYTLSSRWGLCIGYRIMKGVSKRCIAGLLLTRKKSIKQAVKSAAKHSKNNAINTGKEALRQEIARHQKGGGLINTKARKTGRVKRR